MLFFGPVSFTFFSSARLWIRFIRTPQLDDPTCNTCNGALLLHLLTCTLFPLATFRHVSKPLLLWPLVHLLYSFISMRSRCSSQSMWCFSHAFHAQVRLSLVRHAIFVTSSYHPIQLPSNESTQMRCLVVVGAVAAISSGRSPPN